MKFSTPDEIDRFLSDYRHADVFTSSEMVLLAHRLLVATLNAQFSTDFASLANLRFASLTNCSGELCASLRGKTIFEVIYIANQVIANQHTITYWHTYTPDCLSNALALFNRGFDKCQTVYDGECFECSSFIGENSSDVTATTDADKQGSWLSGSLLFFVTFIGVVLIVI
jgi:hypothetical protein